MMCQIFFVLRSTLNPFLAGSPFYGRIEEAPTGKPESRQDTSLIYRTTAEVEAEAAPAAIVPLGTPAFALINRFFELSCSGVGGSI